MALRNKGRFSIDICTVHGKITYTRTVLVPATTEDADRLWNAEGIRSIAPLDCALGIDKVPFKMTPGFMLAASRLSVLARSYEDAVNDVLVQCDVVISGAQLERVTDYVGTLAFEAQKREAEAAMAAALKYDGRKRRRRQNDILYLMWDGAMIHFRDKQEEGDSWGEVKCALAFHSRDIKYYNRKTDGELAHRVTKMDHVGFIGTAEEFFPHFLALAKRNGCYTCSEVVIIVDGSTWVYPYLKKYFPFATIILDKWHAKENAWKFAKAIHRKQELIDKKANHLCELIDKGDTERILDELKGYKDWNRKNAVNFYTYTLNHKEYMKYPEYEEKGYFVGDGIMESSHRYSLQDRMKGPGMRWNVKTGQKVVTLKKKEASGKWNDVEKLMYRQWLTVSET